MKQPTTQPTYTILKQPTQAEVINAISEHYACHTAELNAIYISVAKIGTFNEGHLKDLKHLGIPFMDVMMRVTNSTDLEAEAYIQSGDASYISFVNVMNFIYKDFNPIKTGAGETIEEYRRMESLLSHIYTKPTAEEVTEMIGMIKTRLEYKPMNQNKNFAVKEGYLKCVEILENPDLLLIADIESGKIIDVPVEGLKTVQGRSIASLAYDYLAGKCSGDVLIGVPVKEM